MLVVVLKRLLWAIMADITVHAWWNHVNRLAVYVSPLPALLICMFDTAGFMCAFMQMYPLILTPCSDIIRCVSVSSSKSHLFHLEQKVCSHKMTLASTNCWRTRLIIFLDDLVETSHLYDHSWHFLLSCGDESGLCSGGVFLLSMLHYWLQLREQYASDLLQTISISVLVDYSPTIDARLWQQIMCELYCRSVFW